MHQKAEKVSIIGTGNVGTTAAFTILLKGLVNELVLLSRSKEKADGEKLDLEHALPFLKTTHVIATDDYKDLSGSDIVVVTAGAKQEPGQSRLDVTQTNTQIIEEIVPKITANAPGAIIIIVSNPVDILTFKAANLAKFAPGKVFGSGTLLDTARFRFHISEFLKVNPRSIHTYILGEHGDTSFPVLSSATIGGQPITSFPGYSEEQVQQAFESAKNAAYKIIKSKGATFYAIAVVIARLVETILTDARSVLPVSVPIEDYYGHSGVALSLPCVIGRNGVEKVLHPQLSEEEQKKLSLSVQALKKYL